MRLQATINNANIRGCEKKTGRKGDYLIVRFEDAQGRASELCDKDLEREPYYKRDTTGTLTIDIDEGKQYTTIRIIDFKIDQEAKA